MLNGRDRAQKVCEGPAQNMGWINIMVIKFIDQNNVEEKLKKAVVAGSNEEKISTIIKAY
jgi:hypothetical protein